MTLREQAEQLGIVIPTERTFRIYGIDENDWLNFLAMQGWQCPICERRVAAWNIDHEHVAGWKLMPPEQRRRYVRGVLCIRCNWQVVKLNVPAYVAANYAAYLAAYEARRDAP